MLGSIVIHASVASLLFLMRLKQIQRLLEVGGGSFDPVPKLHITMETKRCYFLGVHLWVFGPHVCLQSKAS